MRTKTNQNTEKTAVSRQQLSQLFSGNLFNFIFRGIGELGAMAQLMAQALLMAFRSPLRLRLIFQQAEFVGVGSIFIIVLTGFFTGAVFTLQSVTGLARVGMESLVGSMVMLAVARELGPVLTALMVTGRVSSAMATELGTMRVTEQIDALEVMAIDPVKYLISPRIIAGAVMVPALTLIFTMVAGIGSYLVAVVMMGIDEGAYLSRIEWYLDPYDFRQGFLKSIAFGLVITLVGCYKGYNASGGARGVGEATTKAVVIGSIAIFLLNYVLTSFLLLFEPK
ncbi:MAG: ABC transporter permease [Deltaproteobacteria bacterium]|nr:ABC transporter permease [Deltaproteobacteria bacterium]